jgi:hypothetical protein
MKTAINWLIDEFFLKNDIEITQETNPALFEVIQQAKEMFEQQIIDANFRGIKLGWKDAVDEFKNKKGMINKSTSELAEQYYKEIFKTDKG